MPEYKVNIKKEKKKKEKVDTSTVVSAYSEEGQRRAKENMVMSTRFKILFFSLLAVLTVAAILLMVWIKNS